MSSAYNTKQLHRRHDWTDQRASMAYMGARPQIFLMTGSPAGMLRAEQGTFRAYSLLSACSCSFNFFATIFPPTFLMFIAARSIPLSLLC